MMNAAESIGTNGTMLPDDREERVIGSEPA